MAWGGIIRIRKMGSNKMEITFKLAKDANLAVTNTDKIDKDWTPYIPNFKLYRTVLVRRIAESLSNEEILEGIKLKQQQPLPSTIKRLNRRNPRNTEEWIPSQTAKMTLRGPFLPSYIFIWYVKCKVTPFVSRVVQCQKCFRFGHNLVQCRGTQTCNLCAGSHCSLQCESVQNKCINCNGPHKASDKNCSSLIFHSRVKDIMAYQNIDYTNAIKIAKGKTPLQRNYNPSQSLTDPINLRLADLLKNSSKNKPNKSLNSNNIQELQHMEQQLAPSSEISDRKNNNPSFSSDQNIGTQISQLSHNSSNPSNNDSRDENSNMIIE